MALQLKDILKVRMERAVKAFHADLEALPESAFTKSFGEKARTVADIVHEINLVNDHLGRSVRGDEPTVIPQEGWITAPADFTEKAQIIKSFDDIVAEQVATVEKMTEQELEEIIPTDFGDVTKFERLLFIPIHIYYHSGQLNYIQTLLGDDDFHW